VRERHAELDGERFRWDDPPVTNEDGDENHPGEDYQCRCTAYPVLPELGDESAPEPDAGGESPPRDPPEEPPAVALPDEEPRRPRLEEVPLVEPTPEVSGRLPEKDKVTPEHDIWPFFEKNPGRVEHFLDRSRYAAEPLEKAGRDSRAAIRDYTGGGYDAINSALRSGVVLNEELTQLRDGIDRFVANAQTAGATIAGRFYRGISLTGEQAARFWADIKVGKVWTNKDFLSTSIADNVADRFAKEGAGRVILEIDGASGVPLGNISIFRSKEGEVLFGRGTRFVVQSIEDEPGGGRKIKLREVR
jgi:hypothetical protein